MQRCYDLNLAYKDSEVGQTGRVVAVFPSFAVGMSMGSVVEGGMPHIS